MGRGFDEVLAGRRMVRSFDGRSIDDGALARVLGAGGRAPSAGNSQGLDLVVLRGDETERYWSVTFPDPAGRARFRWQGLLRAPVLVVVVTDPQAYVARYAEADKAATGLGGGPDAWAVPYWWVDAGMGIEHVLLAAVAEGLGACFFGLFDHEEAVLRALGVPPGRRAVGTVALGHPVPDGPGRSVQRPRRPNLHWTGWSR